MNNDDLIITLNLQCEPNTHSYSLDSSYRLYSHYPSTPTHNFSHAHLNSSQRASVFSSLTSINRACLPITIGGHQHITHQGKYDMLR